MEKREKIAVIGSYAVGMTIIADHFPVAGETVSGRNFEKMHGGKGSNQAVAAARMGANVVYGTCVGKDSFGDWAFELYEQENMNACNVRRSARGLSTGVGLIYVNSEGENEIVIDFAANNEFAPADIEKMVPELKECKLLLMQLEGSMETIEYAAKKCKEIGIPFVLNPAPYSALSKELLKNCTYLTPNQTEGRKILGLEADAAVSDKEIAEGIFELGVSNVILTLGSEGCYIKTGQISTRIEGISVNPVDTTGAGDTFTGAFCVALSEGKDIVEAARFGNVAAGLAVTKYGVIDSIPFREEVENRLSER